MTTSLKIGFLSCTILAAKCAKNCCTRINASARLLAARAMSSALPLHSFASHTDMAAHCSAENLSRYRSNNTLENVDIGNCSMWRLPKASCKFLAPIFFMASSRSVKSTSTRSKHLWRRGRKATVSRVNISQRTNSQSSNKALSSAVSKRCWRITKFWACRQSDWLRAWLVITTSLKVGFCSRTISSANCAKNSCTRVKANAQDRRTFSWASALIWQSCASQIASISFCSAVNLSRYRSKRTRTKVDIGNCNMCRLRKARCRLVAPTFCKAPSCSVKNASTRSKHLWRRGRKATVSRVDISQSTTSQSSNNSRCSTGNFGTCRYQKFFAAFHSLTCLARLLFSSDSKLGFCNCTSSSQ